MDYLIFECPIWLNSVDRNLMEGCNGENNWYKAFVLLVLLVELGIDLTFNDHLCWFMLMFTKAS